MLRAAADRPEARSGPPAVTAVTGTPTRGHQTQEVERARQSKYVFTEPGSSPRVGAQSGGPRV